MKNICEDLILYHDADIFSKLKLPLSIGILGESASGKSTITSELITCLNNFGYTTNRINTDDYYYDHSKEVKEAGSFAEWVKTYNIDCPEAMELSLLKEHINKLKNNESVWLPKYHMDGTAIRQDKYTYVSPSDLIISEGLFIMSIKEAFDILVYIDISQETQKQRWYSRAVERNLGSSTDLLFKNAKANAKKYVIPYKDKCNIIISGEGPKPLYKKLINRILTNFLLKKRG